MAASRSLVEFALTLRQAMWKASGYDLLRHFRPGASLGETRSRVTSADVVHEFRSDAVLTETTPEHHRIVLAVREVTGGEEGDALSGEVRVYADGRREP